MGGSRRVVLPAAILATRSKSKSDATPSANARRAAAGRAASARSAANAANVTYVYCVVRAARRPAVAGQLEPLPGAGAPRVVLLAAKTWLIVADVPTRAFGQDALNKRLQDVDWMSRCGVAHQAVIEAFLGSDAVVPMTLFTIFANDARALAEVKKDAARLEASLDRVAGHVEWVVRVLRGDAAAVAAAGTDGGTAAAGAGSSATRARDAGASPRSGREFLQAKVNQRQAARRAAEEMSAAVRALFTALSDVADEVSDRTEALTASALGSSALLDAACLVGRREEPRFEQAARRMAQPLADRGFRVSVTGPWPCYSFVESASRSRSARRSS
jgi:hypothetical protein